jgi:DNA-binding GntR family transcriptional regulator
MAQPAQMRVNARGPAIGLQLHDLIRDRIVRGELEPGARVSETEIAQEYGVSRQPVREAFIKLAEQSLVEVRPQRGTYVRRISLSAVKTARFVREAVEADICRLAAARANAEGIALLDGLIAGQRAHVASPDPASFMALDEEFHRTLATLAGQGAVWDILQTLKTQMDRVRHISARQLSREKLIDQHQAIVAGIRAGDQDAAEAAIRLHLHEILTDLPSIAAAMPDAFDQDEG